jgi:hypothetical protein
MSGRVGQSLGGWPSSNQLADAPSKLAWAGLLTFQQPGRARVPEVAGELGYVCSTVEERRFSAAERP